MNMTLEEIHARRESFRIAAAPLMKWLAETVHPHHQAIVEADRAELVEGQIAVVTDEFIKD